MSFPARPAGIIFPFKIPSKIFKIIFSSTRLFLKTSKRHKCRFGENSIKFGALLTRLSLNSSRSISLNPSIPQPSLLILYTPFFLRLLRVLTFKFRKFAASLLEVITLFCFKWEIMQVKYFSRFTQTFSQLRCYECFFFVITYSWKLYL